MSASVTSLSSSVLTSMPAASESRLASASASLASPLPVAGMSGLLNSRNLDEKLVVATLATLDSGNPASHLIKQDLKFIIQSRRKLEGKEELQVEFKKPVKEELTSDELKKRSRRRELNRLAARRSREKGQKRKDKLVEEIRELQSQNSELVTCLVSLTDQRNQIVETLRGHMKQCPDYKATQNAAVGLSHRVLEMLGVPHTQVPSSNPELSPPAMPSGSPQCNSPSVSPGVGVKEEVPIFPPAVHETLQTSESVDTPFDQASLPILVGPNVQLEEVSSLTNVKLEEVSPLASPSLFTLTSAPNSPRAILEHSSLLRLSERPMQLSPEHPVHLPLAANLALTARRNSSLGLDSSLPFNMTESTAFVSTESPLHLSIDTLSQVSESSSTQVSAQSSPMLTSSQEERASPPIVYKHKLMKHRKDPQDFTKPSPPVSSSSHPRSGRLMLERSFSFPSSSSETWTHDSMMMSPPGLHTSRGLSSDDRKVPQQSVLGIMESPRGMFPLDGPLDLSNSNSEVRQSTWSNVNKSVIGSSPRRSMERSCSVDGRCQTSTPFNTSTNFNICDARQVTMSQAEADLCLSSQSSTSSVSLDNTSCGKYSKLSMDL